MILQSLAGYYQRLADEGEDIAPEGYEKKEIPFLIVLDEDGRCLGLQDTRTGEGKKKTASVFLIPKGVKKSVNLIANLLWGDPAYVLGVSFKQNKRDNTREKHDLFIAAIKTQVPDYDQDTGLRAVLTFLEKGDYSAVFNDSLWQQVQDSGANITFKLQNENRLVCERRAVIRAITEGGHSKGKENTRMCLITGREATPVRLHTAIKGVREAQSSGANIVSFNLNAFNSYGKEQGYNAPVSESAAFAYTTALNRLLSKGSRQKIQVGDASTVFWAERKHELEKLCYDFFGREPEKGESEQDYEQLRAFFDSPRSGVLPELDPKTRFYILGLAPNAARIAVRFWYADTAGAFATHIWQHVNDLEMVKSPREWRRIGLKNLLRSAALGEEDKNIPPKLAGDTMRAIITGAPYPQTLLPLLINRIRAEQAAKSSSGKPVPNVTYTRAAFLKAILVREAKIYQKPEKEVEMALDTTNTNSGYLLGRLFAVLERTQEAASPGINATIRDRFYGAASGTPLVAFPQLIKLNRHHLAKLENKGTRINLEKQIGGIMDDLDAGNPFPPHLDLRDQGRFAVGYYQQHQAFFNSKTNKGEE